MKHDFYPGAPLLPFVFKKHRQHAHAWYADPTGVYVNWGGEPMRVEISGVSAKLTPEQTECLRDHGCSTCVPSDAAAWQLAQLGFVEIDRGRFGLYSKITEAGRQYLVRKASRGARATSQVGPAPVKKPDSNTHSEATAEPAKAGHSCGAAAPRPRRNAAKEAGQTPDYVKIAASSPPAVPLKAGAPNDATTAPHRGTAPRQTAHTRRETNNKSAKTSGTTPNAVRVITGSKVTYYPLSMYEVVHGTKHCVRTLNKLYRAYPLAASVGDVEVR